MNTAKGFTLIELVVSVGIVAVIAAVTVFVLNPAELLRQARDARRVNDLQLLDQSTALLLPTKLDGPNYSGSCKGQANQRIFVSVPSDNGETTPVPPLGWVYNQVPKSTSHNTDGTGWLPLDFTKPGQLGVSNPISSIPTDPVNTFASGLYYTYVCGSYSYTAKMESQKYIKLAATPGDIDPTIFKLGNALALTPLRPVPLNGPPLPKGNRILTIDVNTPADGNYDAAFNKAKSAGADAVEMSVFFDQLETAPFVYNPIPNFLAIANTYYPSSNTKVALVISVIDTTKKRVPADLAAINFDAPQMITRFRALLDYVFSQIPNLELTSLSIGNEIDSYLVTDPNLWQQYETFFANVSAYARSKRSGLVVGTKITFAGLTGATQAHALSINRYSDAIFLTYYPLNPDFSVKSPSVVSGDFDTVAALSTKPIYFLEAGYPSSPTDGSSEQLQGQFIHNVFRAWDRNADRVRMISFNWLHDLSPSTLADLAIYYGSSDPKFLAYLGSLGLRAYAGSGVDKPAFLALHDEAGARGWVVGATGFPFFAITAPATGAVVSGGAMVSGTASNDRTISGISALTR